LALGHGARWHHGGLGFFCTLGPLPGSGNFYLSEAFSIRAVFLAGFRAVPNISNIFPQLCQLAQRSPKHGAGGSG